MDLKIQIKKPADFDFSQTLMFLTRGFDECLHQVQGGAVYKALSTEKEEGLIRVSEEGNLLNVELLCGDISRENLETYVKNWFDTDRELRIFYERLAAQKPHSELIQYRGFRITFMNDLFEALAWSIIGQQINLTFAYKVKRAFVEKYGRKITHEGKPYFLFPRPQDLTEVKIEDLRELQFSNRKAEYLLGIADLMRSGDLSRSLFSRLGSTGEMIEECIKIRGIGEWTANYAIMKSLRRMDCIPWGDTGILDAIKKLTGLDRKPMREEVANFYQPLNGWESYLTFYSWRSLY